MLLRRDGKHCSTKVRTAPASTCVTSFLRYGLKLHTVAYLPHDVPKLYYETVGFSNNDCDFCHRQKDPFLIQCGLGN